MELGAERTLMTAGRIDEAIRSLTDKILSRPDPSAFDLLSRCYIAAHEYHEALVIQDLARSCVALR
jgi:hypothetical protein